MRVAATLAFAVSLLGCTAAIVPKHSTPSGEITPPLVLHRVEPRYDACATEHFNTASIAIVDMTIGEDGMVHEVKVVQSAHPCVDSVIMEALKQWRFRPTMYRGEAKRTIFTLTVNLKERADKN